MNASIKNRLVIILFFYSFFIISCTKDKSDASFQSDIVIDLDGNIYHFDTIGTQIWMRENLKVTRFRNGDSIPCVRKNNEWVKLTTAAYCNSKNNDSLANIYGRLYNWYAVSDTREISPIGWHVATNIEWFELSEYLGGNIIAGGRLKDTGSVHWINNCNATNEYGFTALPGGYRSQSNGLCNSLGLIGYWWANTELDSNFAVGCRINNYDATFSRKGELKEFGFSVRCVKD